MSCYLIHGSKKYCKYNDVSFENIFKRKDHKKREKNKPKLNKIEIARLLEEY